MYTDAGPLRQLRAQARTLLPPRAFLKRDRGDALFVSNAPVFAPETREVPGFLAERRGALLYLLPEPGWVLRWERRFREPPDDLCAGLVRFKGVPPDRENLALFARAAKLLDGHPSPEEVAALDRALRQRAAVALRGGCGGGLYATAILRNMLERKDLHSDEQPQRPIKKGRNPMKIQYFGHSCFALTCADGTVLVLDPFDETVPYPQCTVKCDAALLTHDHFDHNHTQSLTGDFRTIREPGSYSVGAARITAVPCFHDEVRGAKRGSNLIYRIEADGVTLAHLGDLGHMPNDEQLAALTGLDLMLIPVGGYFTIETPQAEEIIALAKPRCAVAMHYRIHKTDTNPISTVEQFARDMSAARMPHIIEVTPESVAKLPAAIVMDYKG